MKAPDIAPKPVRVLPMRLIILLGALLIVCIVALIAQKRGMEEKWLSRQSLDSLQKEAAQPNAGPLTSLAYGEKLAAAGRLPEALTAFQKAEKALSPDQKDAVAERVLARLGLTIAQLGGDENALPYLDRARKINDENAQVAMGYGIIFLHRHMLHFAVNQFKLAAAIEPENYEAQYLLGKAYNDNQEPQAAVDALKKAVALAPRFASAQVELGHAYAYQAQFAPAVEQFRKGLALEPDNPFIQRALGAALGMSARSREEYQQAVAILEKNLQEEPNNENLVFTLGQLHLRFQNYDEAYRYLTKAVQMKPTYTEAWYNLERAEQFRGNDKEAAKAHANFVHQRALHDDAIYAEKKVAANLKDPDARLNLVKRYHTAGNVIGAYWQLKTALKLKPDFPEAQKEMESLQREYQRVMTQHGSMELKRDESNAFGPPPPPEMMSSVTGAPAPPSH